MIKKNKKERPKIYERNPNTGVVRWRYIDESSITLSESGEIIKEKTLNKAKKITIKKDKEMFKNNDRTNDARNT